jgi:hypothetical protein
MSGREACRYFSREAEIDVVRRQLDALAHWRGQTGLSVAEGARSLELCRSEQTLLDTAASTGCVPDRLSHVTTAPNADFG